ncbi:hypothetical protein EGR_07613 [Echinococcus granulosus]|uniref:Uncharacterized protein n=1 Tax=Echinococcus granulosus TaxID=6210 RepID=W6UHG4_ECHGR|nr:hypothetical protein EGR_07613 [Echinococcus granulosus]EUB57522.1 hypothetical protein EGR_07613 [Echinococcus granulosus]
MMPNGVASPVRHQEDANVDEFLKQLLDGPSMRFDETLLRPVECGGVQIPVPLGAVFVTLHRKHNEQMSGEPFYSFLQDGNFDYNISSDMEDAELGATLDTLVSSNITLEECYNTLDKYDAGALYRLLYRLMRRLSFKPFPISGRSCEIISTIDLFDDTDPVLRGHLKFWEKEPIGMEFEQPESFQLPEIDDENRKNCQVLFRLEINWVTNKVRQYPYRQDRVTWAWERAIWDMQAHILKNALCVNYSNFWNPRVELKEKIIHDNKECNQAACACRFFVNPALP